MDWITPHLAVGNVEDALGIRGPRPPVDSVLCLSGFPTLSHIPNLRWAGIPLIDGPGNEPARLLEAVGFIHTEIGAGRKVLVHCMEGRSRSVLLAALYLAATAGHTLEHSIRLVGARRSLAAVDPGLLASLPSAWREMPGSWSAAGG